MTSARFLADLRANLVRGDARARARLMLDQWVYQPGLPDNAARPDPAAFAAVDAAVAAPSTPAAPPARLPYAGWTTGRAAALPQRRCRASCRSARLAELDRAFGLSQSGNSEVLFAWLQLALANRYEPAVPAAERFLPSMGRRKFVAPSVRDPDRRGRMGPADRRAALRPRPRRLSQRDHRLRSTG